MTKAQRVKYALAAPVFVLATVVAQFGYTSSVSAAPVTWDGGAGDGLFSSAANWSNDTVPTNGDNLIFSASGVTNSDVVVTNDLSNLSVSGISLSGTPTGYGQFSIAGNSFTLTGDITNTATYSGYSSLLDITAPIVLGDYISAEVVSFTAVNVGTHELSLNVPDDVCAPSLGLLSGSGSVVITGEDEYAAYSTPSTGTSSFTGDLTVNSGLLYITDGNAFTQSALIETTGTGSVSLVSSSNETFNLSLRLGGSGSIMANQNGGGCGGSMPQSPFTTTVPGPVSLASNYKFSGDNNLTLTGSYAANNFSFTTENGSAGTLTTPDGTSEPQPFTTELNGDQPSMGVGVGNKETAILNGTRSNITVNAGGTLKGTGTTGSLYVDGIVNPGNSPGTLTVLDSYVQTGIYQAEILNTGSYDKLVVGDSGDGSGSVQLDATATLEVVMFDGWSVKAGDTFTILDNLSNNAINGTFQGLAEGAQFTVDGAVFSISYVGGTGNDIVLTAINSVSAPNTGVFQAVKANPAIVAILGVVSAAAVLGLALRRKTNR